MTKSGRTRRSGSKIPRIKAGSAQVPIYESAVRGATRFTIAFYRDGRRIRQTFSTMDAAVGEARIAATKIQNGMARAADLSVADRDTYRAAQSLLSELKVPLLSAVEEYVRCRKLLGESPLLPAVEEYLRRTRGVRLGATIPDVVKEFLVAKAQDGVSRRYLNQLRSDMNRFAVAFPSAILHVKSEQIDQCLRSLGVVPRTRNGILTSLRTFFTFAKSRSYLSRSEVTEADALAKARVGDTDTVIFKPAQMRSLLEAASLDIIPYLAIAAFAGLRPAEIERLHWSAINLDRRIIEVRAGQAKTASRRIVPISENLVAWLAPHAGTGLVIPTKEIYRQVMALAARVEIEWPRNVLRHSFISYRLPIVKSAEQVALEAGNSPAIIFKHYRELATEEEAHQWFGITPAV
jgi:Phage integrase family